MTQGQVGRAKSSVSGSTLPIDHCLLPISSYPDLVQPCTAHTVAFRPGQDTTTAMAQGRADFQTRSREVEGHILIAYFNEADRWLLEKHFKIIVIWRDIL